jgi:urease accessory protein
MFSLAKKPALDVIRQAIDAAHNHLPAVDLVVERLTLAKRRWRAAAVDGREFGFDLEEPLQHGDVVFQTATHRYVISQIPEQVLRLALLDPVQAARLGWQVGNLHFRIMIDAGFVLVEDDPALRQMLVREGIDFSPTQAIFQPLAGAAGHEHHH